MATEERSVGGASEVKPVKKASWLQSLVAVGICGGAMFWAYRTSMEGLKPVLKATRLLRSGDVDDRRTAARQLGSCDKEELEEAAPALVAALEDGLPEVRSEVATALGNVTSNAIRTEGKLALVKQTMNALVGALGDSSPDVRRSAAMSIGACASQPWGTEPPLDLDSAVAKLTGLLNDDTATVRSSAETAVARLAAKAPIAPPTALVEGVTTWPSKESRRSAALALGTFKKDFGPTVTALTKALEDKEPEVRSDAAVALRTIGLDAAPAMPTLVKHLGESFVPPPAAPSLMSSLPPGGGAGGAGGTPEPTDPPTQAARAIGRIASAQFQQSKTAPTADVIEALIKAVGSARQELQAATLDAIRRIGKGASAAVVPLGQTLTDSAAKPGSRPTVASLLADIAPGTDRANDAIAALTAALDSTDDETKMAAVTALGRFGPAAIASLPKLQAIGEARKDDAPASTVIKLAIDRLEGKAPPEAPRRKGQRRGR